MKKLLLLLVWVCCVARVPAQSYIPYSIGYTATALHVLSANGDTMKMGTSSGSVVATTHIMMINDTTVLAGFLGTIKYFSNTFETDLSVSKGYYPAYVNLQWTVKRYADQITRFYIWRKEYGSTKDSVLVGTVASTESQWKDEYAESGVIYKYTLLAAGISNNFVEKYLNYIDGIGFRFPSGQVSGRITYKGGTAVANVNVYAQTDDILGGKSIKLNGSNAFIGYSPNLNDPFYKFDTAFCFQGWFKPLTTGAACLLEKGSQYRITYQAGTITFAGGGASVSVNFAQKADTFFNVSAVYTSDSIKLFVLYNNQTYWKASAKTSSIPPTNNETVYIGRSTTGQYFNGYADELRLWHRSLTDYEILNKTGVIISGTENGLTSYYRCDEGVGDNAFDLSRIGYTFNEHHAYINHGEWTTVTPFKTQLAYKGITDQNGNYIISGIPYKTSGSTYHITPVYGVHQFDPTETLLLVGDESSTHNGINFTDASSFPVNGNIKYRNTFYPVQGALLKVDGQTAVNSSGTVISTDANGNFTIDVPIGKHYISVYMNGHVFENGGRYPQPEVTNKEPLKDFQGSVSGLQFIDTTLIKVVGRVVGGPVQGAKTPGLGKSTNNLGKATIELSTQSQHDLMDTTINISGQWPNNYYKGSTISSSGSTAWNIQSTSPKSITINPDVKTGEYIAWLLPEKYTITKVTAGNYSFGENYRTVLDLTSAFTWSQAADTTVTGYSTSPVGKLDSTIRVDSIRYQATKDFIYRETPSISVTGTDGSSVFWDKTATIDNETVALIDSRDSVLTSHPVFTQRGLYTLKINVFEKYVNTDDPNQPVTDNVPVNDGTVEIQNNLALDITKQAYTIDSNGQVKYQFTAGLPNTTISNTGDDSYTKTMTIVALTDDGNIKTPWHSFEGYVLGGLPTGNNFVTTGPTKVDMILRDPPGSNSYSYLQQGTSVTSSSTYNAHGTFTGSENLKFQFGTEVSTFAGVGAGTIVNVDYKNDITIGVTHEASWVNGNTTTNTTTTTQKWATSASSDYVDAMGDLFIGHATNIVYGKSVFVDLLPLSDCTNGAGDTIKGTTKSYRIGTKTGIRLNPEFGTSFTYSLNHIENYLIPNLISLRNAFLEKGDGVYVSKNAKGSSNYGNSNTSFTTTADPNIQDGDSYKITIPANWPDPNLFVDSVAFFNKQVAEWQDILKRNENEKIKATVEKNISFDAGATYEYSISYDTITTDVHTTDFTISAAFSSDIGTSVSKFGLSVQLEENLGGGREYTTEKDTDKTVTYGYVLADDSEGDYISLDVKNPPSQTGPIFAIRGGQTTCPFEDAVISKYTGTKTVLSQATMQREKPQVSVKTSTLTDIPEDQTANFTLLISNASETGDAAWFEIIVDNTTNPNGANVMIDGSSIGNGRLVNVPANTTISKILSIGKTLNDVYDYKNIRIIVHSTCQYDPYNSLPDIADTTEVSAYFKPVCTAVNLKSPNDLWTVNTATGPSLDIAIDGYNLKHSTFNNLLFQYKPTSSSQWITDETFYVNKADYDAADKPKAFIDGQSSLSYKWDLSSLSDRQYNIRVKSVCIDGTEHASTILEGIKDAKPPKVFGTPQPGDGILSPNDDISVSFDEAIQTGLLTSYNFSVRDVLNGTKTNHNASLYFDGVQAYANCLNGISLNDKPFTFEFWAKRATTGAQVVYSMGSDVEIGFNADNQFYAKLGSTSVTTGESYTDLTTWNHYAVSYNKATKTADIYVNDVISRESMPVTGSITGGGKMLFGKSSTGDRFFNGSLHEFRVWDKSLAFTKVYANMYTSFNGKEIGLTGYWPMNEADGTKAQDKARNRHAVLYGTAWRVYPSGSARSFNGTSDYIDISTGSTVVITADMDYTLEFWFKGSSQTNTTLFSNGKGTTEDELLVGFNSSGELYAQNNNLSMVASGENFLDSKWHHLAMVMKRNGNVILYVDAVQKATLLGADWSGLAGSVMSLGARRYKDQGVTHDNFFSGKIDEVRIWNLARELKQLQLDKNNHLTGAEIGLCAYYPFEYYYYNMGVPEIRETLDDKYVPQYTGYPTGGTASAAGGEFSDDVPNIKDSRPVQQIAFDYTANTDKIIVTPTESNALIENTTVEITVQNVEDLNENRLVSPVTWTAYINKNQVLWDATELDLKKKAYDPYTFNVDIVNLGGTQQSFSLLNLPAWLTASVTSGKLDANSKQSITFTVNDALSIGNYQEAVYLHSDYGFDEKLLINLNVYQEEPTWTVDKNNFQYSMNVIAQVEIDNEISTDAGDMIGAFVGTECRGTAHLAYNQAYDKYLAFIDIYSNKEMGDSVKFKIWDASEGKIRSKITPSYVFISNDIKGTINNPIILRAIDGYYTSIPLNKGWNWISFNLNSSDLASMNLLNKGNRTSGDQIKGPIDSTGLILFDNYAAGNWSNNFESKGGLQPGYLYMVKSSLADTIVLTGSKIKTESSPLSLHKGWNWLGFTPLSAITVNDAFAYYTPKEGDLLKSKYAFAMYSGASGWIGSLGYMKPGDGYLFSSSTGGTLTYPESGLFKSKETDNSGLVVNVKGWEDLSANYPLNMTMVAKVILADKSLAGEGWYLGAFVGDKCRGIASSQYSAIDKNDNFFINIAGESNNENVQFKLLDRTNDKVYAIQQSLAYGSNSMIGSLSSPFELNVTSESAQIIGEIQECTAIPNPFINTLKIMIRSSLEGPVTLQFCNTLGNLIETRQATLVKGQNEVNFDKGLADKLTSGIYYLKILANGHCHVIKLVKQ